MAFGCGSRAPHGGLFVIGIIENAPMSLWHLLSEQSSQWQESYFEKAIKYRKINELLLVKKDIKYN